MLETYRFSKSHILIWLVGVVAILIIWLGVTTLLTFLDYDASWYAKLTAVIIGFLVALISQVGFIISPILEYHPNKTLKIGSLVSILPSLFIFLWGFLKTFQEQTSGNLDTWRAIFLISTGLVILIYLWQMSKLFKWIISSPKVERILSIRK